MFVSYFMKLAGVGVGGVGAMSGGGLVTGGGFTTPAQLAKKDPNCPINQFVAKWGLDAGAETMLRTASPDLQKLALTNFNPGPGMTNCSGKFVSYLKKLPTFAGLK